MLAFEDADVTFVLVSFFMIFISAFVNMVFLFAMVMVTMGFSLQCRFASVLNSGDMSTVSSMINN